MRGYRGLTDAALRATQEAASGRFVVEGVRAVRLVLETGWPIESVLILQSKAASLADVIAQAEQRSAPVYLADQAAIDEVTGFHVHRGVLALAVRPPPGDMRSILAGVRSAVVVEGVNDHENLGSIFRNCAGLGGEAVLMDPSTCDPLYRRSVRVSLGHVLRVPFARAEPWPESLRWVRDSGITLVALSPSGGVALAQVGRLERFAVMVGAEDAGLTPAALQHADVVARIPMTAGTDSLNVATAAAIGLYQLGL